MTRRHDFALAVVMLGFVYIVIRRWSGVSVAQIM